MYTPQEDHRQCMNLPTFDAVLVARGIANALRNTHPLTNGCSSFLGSYCAALLTATLQSLIFRHDTNELSDYRC